MDAAIREAIPREVAESVKPFDHEPSLHDLLIESFRGSRRWMNAMAALWIFAALAMLVLSAFRFFRAESMREMVAWAVGFLWFSLWIAMLKVWFWMELQRLSILRSVRRLELQVSNLSRIGSPQA